MGSVIHIPAVSLPETNLTVLEPKKELREIIDNYLGSDVANLYDEVIEEVEQDIWEIAEEGKVDTKDCDKSVYDLICELADTIPDYGAQQEEYDRLMDAILIKAGRWIPVTEDIPDNEDMCLVSCKTQKGVRSVNRAYYSNGSWHGSGSMSGVEAWRPLPEPYMGGGK